MDQPTINSVVFQRDSYTLATMTAGELEALYDTATNAHMRAVENNALAITSDATYARLKTQYGFVQQTVEAWREYRAWQSQAVAA